MFGLFKKKPATYPPESHWSVCRGTHNGKPMFLRRNDSAAQLSGHNEFRSRVGIAVPLRAPNADGLPEEEELNQLNAIEDSLASRLEAEQKSLQVLAITTSGMREFIFYTRDSEAARLVLEALRSEVTSHELQSYIAEDPKWALYREFA